MGKNQVVFEVRFTIQVIAAAPDAGTGVNHDNGAAAGPYFNAGGVAPVSQIRFAGNRNGSPGPPATDKHDVLITSDSVNPPIFAVAGGRKR
jgi:hypothetical protein